nr:alpha/beta fold hydrolase [Salsipaludibacter albus]
MVDESPAATRSWEVNVTGMAPWELRLTPRGCAVQPGAAVDPDVRFHTDAITWLDIVSGRSDAVGAFQAGRLEVRGDLSLAVLLGTMFVPGHETRRHVQRVRTRVLDLEVESLVVGSGEPVVLIHGLGASKVTFVPSIDDLALDHHVHALDLPGYGNSDAPLPTGDRYSLRWYADVVVDYLRANDLDDVHLVGNSMGGRIAAEVALRRPDLVASLTGLCAAVPLESVRYARPLLRRLPLHWVAASPVWLPADALQEGIRSLFFEASRLPAANLSAAVDEARLQIERRDYRLALAAGARGVALDRTRGRRGLWRRLEQLSVPSLWIFGGADPLVESGAAARAQQALPSSATVELWHDCGHVPQFELPDRTHDRIRRFLAEVAERRATA